MHSNSTSCYESKDSLMESKTEEVDVNSPSKVDVKDGDTTKETQDKDEDENDTTAASNVLKNTNLADKTAAIVNMFFMIGSAIGPVMGGGLYDSIEFSDTCLVMAAICFLYTIIYFSVTVCCNRK